MSVSLISAAFRCDVPPGPKLLLLALADSANDDDGGCWFLIRTLCLKTSCGERTVQGHLSWLERAGYVRRQFRPGRSSEFYLSLEKLGIDPGAACRGDSRGAGVRPGTPADSAPRRFCTPAGSAPTPAESAPTPVESAPTPAESAPISGSYPVLDPLTNPPEAGRVKNAFPGSPEGARKAPPEGLARGNGPGGRSFSLHASSERERSWEERSANLRKLRDTLRGIGS
jgi:hypothetical protein